MTHYQGDVKFRSREYFFSNQPVCRDGLDKNVTYMQHSVSRFGKTPKFQCLVLSYLLCKINMYDAFVKRSPVQYFCLSYSILFISIQVSYTFLRQLFSADAEHCVRYTYCIITICNLLEFPLQWVDIIVRVCYSSFKKFNDSQHFQINLLSFEKKDRYFRKENMLLK